MLYKSINLEKIKYYVKDQDGRETELKLGGDFDIDISDITELITSESGKVIDLESQIRKKEMTNEFTMLNGSSQINIAYRKINKKRDEIQFIKLTETNVDNVLNFINTHYPMIHNPYVDIGLRDPSRRRRYLESILKYAVSDVYVVKDDFMSPSILSEKEFLKRYVIQEVK